MTRLSRGSKIVAIAKNPKQMTKKLPVQPRGLDVLQRTVGKTVASNGIAIGHGQAKALMPVAKGNKENEEEFIINEDNNENLSENNIFLYFQELLYGLEILNNAFTYFYKQYLINIINIVKKGDNDYFANMILCKETISIFLTLQSEYQFLYNNKMKKCNGPYDIGESKTQNIFKSKDNSFYATYIFLRDSKGYNLIKKIKDLTKYKQHQYSNRFLSVCENIQENYIIASKYFENFINNEFQSDMRVSISASRENGHTKLHFTKFKENLQDYSCDKMTRSDIMNIIKHNWKIDNETSKYKDYAVPYDKEVVSCIKPTNLTKSIATVESSNEYLTPLNDSISFNKLNDLCNVVTAERSNNPSPITDKIQDETSISGADSKAIISEGIKEDSQYKVMIYIYINIYIYL
jgi:hypothetical protein